jgi:hypothetical protein
MNRTRILLQALSVGFVSVLGFASFAEEPTHGVTDTEIEQAAQQRQSFYDSAGWRHPDEQRDMAHGDRKRHA